MNLGTTVACLSSKSRNIYSINNQTHPTSSATTTTPPVINKNRPGGRLSRKSSANSSTKSQQKKPKKLLESIKEGHQQQQHVLYSANSYQDCPCDHHRLARLRQESSQENYVDLVTASFEASLAPLRGLLTPSISTVIPGSTLIAMDREEVVGEQSEKELFRAARQHPPLPLPPCLVVGWN